ncbi:MAG: nuclear transport factor 2 family protein [Dermatophilaceae bacterium]
MTSFHTFLAARERASTAFVEGDAGPLLAVSVDNDPATIYPPTGAVVVGADKVNAGNAAGAETFAPGAENRFDVLHSGSDGELGYWTGVQRSKVVMKDKPEPVTMNLRITELFRRVDGEWKLFHRHADMLQEQ